MRITYPQMEMVMDGLITIYAPRGFDEGDFEALGWLRTIFRSGNRPEVRLMLTGLVGVDLFARNVTEPEAVATGSEMDAAAMLVRKPALVNSAIYLRRPVATALGSVTEQEGGDACVPRAIFASSKRWRSVTPFSLPRFPNRGGGKPPRPRDLPEAQLTQELIARGFSKPISIKRIEGYQPIGRPFVRWLEFQTRRFKGTQGKGLAGFEIEFAEPVAGPIAVGFGCHFGLGLFMPC